MKTKYFFIGFFSTLLLLFIIGFSLYQQIKKQKHEMETATIKDQISFETRVFQMKSEDLSKLKLSSIINDDIIDVNNKKYLFINFWATWCAPCVAEFPTIQSLTEDSNISKLPIQFVFSSDEDIEKQKGFLNQKDFKLNFCKSTDIIPEIFAKNPIPATYIVNTQNGITYKIVGSHNWNSELMKTFLENLK